MELLINGLLVQGADRNRIQAKLFGGARTIKGLADIGARNARFAQEFLAREEISVLPGSLGGSSGRRVEFWPVTGRARQNFMAPTDPELMNSLNKKPALTIKSSDVELF
jgi:chemotaxis protein CheD